METECRSGDTVAEVVINEKRPRAATELQIRGGNPKRLLRRWDPVELSVKDADEHAEPLQNDVAVLARPYCS